MQHHIYQAIKKRLQAQVTPAPTYIDWYSGQYLEEEMEDGGQLLWATPAIFIEFLPIKWETIGQLVQSAHLSFNLHLVNESFYDDERRFTDTDALNHLGQASSVFSAMQGFRAHLSYVPGFEALANTPNDRVLVETITRTTSEPDHAMRRQLVEVQGFTTKIYDYGATRHWTEVMATLNDSEVFV